MPDYNKDPRKAYPEAKQDMLAMLELGIHPMQREGRIKTHDTKICLECNREFASQKALQGHMTYCIGEYVPPPSRRRY